MYSSVIWARGQSCGAKWYGVSMGELGGDRDESEEREEREARDCGVSCERLLLLCVMCSGLKTEQSLDALSGGSRYRRCGSRASAAPSWRSYCGTP